MKLFQAVQKNLESARISRSRVSFDLISELKHIVPYGLSIILPFIYIIHVAETPKQYVETIIVIELPLLAVIVNLSFRLHSRTIFRTMAEVENCINKSEHEIYTYILIMFQPSQTTRFCTISDRSISIDHSLWIEFVNEEKCIYFFQDYTFQNLIVQCTKMSISWSKNGVNSSNITLEKLLFRC